jgi:hypothetical protein
MADYRLQIGWDGLWGQHTLTSQIYLLIHNILSRVSDRRRVLDWQSDLLHLTINYNWVSPDSLSLPTHDWIYHNNSAAIVTAATLVIGELQVPFLFPWIPTHQLNSPTTPKTTPNLQLQQLSHSTATGLTTESSGVYDLWSDCRGDSAFGFGCLAITEETGTLRPRACTLPSNVYSSACTSQYLQCVP